MPVSSKVAEIIAAELQDQLIFKPHLTGRGWWYLIERIEPDGRIFQTQLNEIKARKIIGDKLGNRYRTTSGYLQSDLNACMKFLQMYLSK